jgi:hypothetical protein
MRSLWVRSARYWENGDNKRAVADLNQLIELFGDLPQPEVREGVAEAIARKDTILKRELEDQQELTAIEKNLSAQPDSSCATARVRSGEALARKVALLVQLGRNDEAIVVADGLAARFEDETDPDALADLGHRLLDAADRLATAHHAEYGLELSESVARRMIDTTDPARRRLGASAQIAVSMLLERLGRPDEAIIAREAILPFGEAALPALDQLALEALQVRAGPTGRVTLASLALMRAVVLAQLERMDEAVEATNDIINKFGQEPDEQIRRIVNAAYEVRASAAAEQGE